MKVRTRNAEFRLARNQIWVVFQIKPKHENYVTEIASINGGVF